MKAGSPEYLAVHWWVKRQLGVATQCENCGKVKTNPHTIQWANISHEYKYDVSDWRQLCVRCHSVYDKRGRERVVGYCIDGHKMTPENTYLRTDKKGLEPYIYDECRRCRAIARKKYKVINGLVSNRRKYE